MVCDHNCFQCQFDDCICDGEMTAAERLESERRERACDPMFDVKERNRRNRMASYYNNIELNREKMREYAKRNRGRLNAYHRKWYAEHRAKRKKEV